MKKKTIAALLIHLMLLGGCVSVSEPPKDLPAAEKEEESFDPEEGLLHHQEGIDLMPGNIELSGMDLTLVSVMSREYVLAE
jgi:PBP1b-binding outer membrane lipoprotein LpoB